MARSLAALAAALSLVATACGGLDSPDLSTGAIAGRVAPAYPGGRAYVLGRPELAAELDADGAFLLAPVPVGAAEVVVFDGDVRAGRLPAVVRGAEVAWVGPAPDRRSDGSVGPAGPDGEPFPPQSGAGDGLLPLAGTIVATATAGGAPVDGVRFDVEGTDQLGVAPGEGGAVLGPLPPGTFEVVARAAGFAEVRRTVTVGAGETVAVQLALGVQ